MTKRLEIPRSSGVGRPPENHPARQAAVRAFTHDVVNPLAAIRMSAGALRARSTLIEDEISHIDRIEEATETIIRLVAMLAPLADGAERPPVTTAVTPSVDLYVLCCEMAALRRFTDGAAIHCRAFGDPRGAWDHRQVANVLSGLLDQAIARLGKGARVNVSVTGLARHVRVEIHGLGRSSARQRKTSLDVSPAVRSAPPGAVIDAIASGNGGVVYRLRLPRWNLAAAKGGAKSQHTPNDRKSSS